MNEFKCGGIAMRIRTVKIKNFRGYDEEIQIDFGNLTAFVGKNDIGKSSVLDALDIFFNNGNATVKIDKDDINKSRLLDGDTEICISVCFDNLPDKLVIDATNDTNLQQEYLTNSDGQLEIIKKYSNAGNAKVFIKAIHPQNPECNDLLLKKDNELRKIIDSKGITCSDKTKNAVMRNAIWNYFGDDLQLGQAEIDVTKGETKSIWDKLQSYLPLYSLFQSDRKNSDGDSEVQDPLKEAVKEILNNEQLKKELNDVADEVEKKLKEVSSRTLDKLREMNPEVANTLNPVIPPAKSLKWADVFKSVSITGDENIPINKRGSGVKRLILLNFFRAEAERRIQESNATSIIYAIEEPETSQHTENQKKLIRAFLTLADAPNTQVIITTHSSIIVKQLHFSNLRLISIEDSHRKISNVLPGQLPYPSLNEVNFLAFSDITEEYHNELYGFIEEGGLLSSFREGKPTQKYIRDLGNGKTKEESKILTEYIRHQIHHPENKLNTHYTDVELKESICLMRDFIQNLKK